MADPRRLELDELANRPGTYFNPETEVLIVVDDSADLDSEIFDIEDLDGADWVQVSDEVPIDEARRDELLESFQADHTPGVGIDEDEDEDEEFEDAAEYEGGEGLEDGESEPD